VLVFLERGGRIVFANAEARRLQGDVAQTWTDRPVEDVLWGLSPGTAEPQTPIVPTRRGSSFHATLPGRDGQMIPVEGTYCVLDVGSREAVIVAHVSGRQQTPRSALMDDVLASIPEAVAIEHGGHLLYTNPSFCNMFGFSTDEASGESLRSLIVPETRWTEHQMLLKSVEERGTTTIETVRETKLGDLLDVSLQCAPLLVDSRSVGYVYTYRDIGQRKQTERKLEHDALHDAQTGLPNRSLFMDRLNQALTKRIRRPDHNCGVLFLDLDHFKQVNDALGHAAGDVLLRSVAELLTRSLRPQDSAARLSGDEFAILVENILSPSDLEVIAKRILSEMEKPFEIFDHFVQASCSIGAAMAGLEHKNADQLIRDADFAMYRAKQNGRGCYEVFDTHLEICISSLQQRERELRQVLEQRLFEFRYQPLFDLKTGRVIYVESLLRWRRADGSVDGFRDLMDVAEDTGLSISLGREALAAACEQLKSWNEKNPAVRLTIALNLTKRQFFNPELVAQVEQALSINQVAADQLVLEITESSLNENPDAAIAVLQRLTDLGVRTALDDYGAGLAALNHLVRAPLHYIKLDAQIAAAATVHGRQQLLLAALLELGRNLGVLFVAQGITTAEQLQELIRLGCPLGQGTLLSEPMEPDMAHALATTLPSDL